jgi:fibronectin type 3 domain-containing protein
MLARFLTSSIVGLWLAVFSLFSHAAAVTYAPSLAKGWNLVGNSVAAPLDVKASFGGQAASITSIWKWNASTSRWAFYAPSLDTANTLVSYCASKGYDVLTSINQGEGFWVNAAASAALGTQSGTGFALAAADMTKGWNLAATGDDITPAAFSTAVGNVTTLWAWDNVNNAWFFYAPTLAASNGLASYITGKGYQDFGVTTLGNGRGFWVNYAGATGGTGGTTPPTTTCLLTGTASAVVGGVAGPLVANYCYALTAPFTCDARGMGVTATFIDEMFKAGFSNVTTAATSYTPLTDCTQAPANTQAGTFLRTIDGNGSVTTLAGKALPAPLSVTDPLVDGTAGDARFGFKSIFGASGVVSDGTSLFVLDQGYYAIRKVDIATGATSTLAGGTRGYLNGTGTAAMFYAPGAIAIDASKTNLYVTDYRYIRKIEIATGIVTTVVGLATYFDANAGQTIDGHFINASTGGQDWFMGANAEGIVADATSLYVLDDDKTSTSMGRILKVDIATMTVTNFTTISNYTPSSSSTSFLLDGGNLYLAGNQQVRKINLATKVETLLAGGSSSSLRDGIGAAAMFRNVTSGLASDGTNLYVADNSAIRKIELATGIVSTIAGKEAAGYADGMGAAAKFSGLGGMTMVGTYLYATDNFSTIRRIQTNGTGGTTPSPISNSTATTGPMAGTWSYNSPGGAAWSTVTDATVPNGGAVYKAAAVAQDQSTIASITVTQTGNGVVSFYKKVSSMACCDYLVFTIDGVEPTNARWSGNVAWSPASFALTAGTHTLRWSYVKGSATFVNTAGVQDTAWISQVAVTAAPPVVSGLAPASGAIASLSKILGTDLNNFSPLPTVNFNAGNTNYQASTPYALSADYTSLEFAVPQDLAAGDYSVTLGNGAAAPQTAGTFTIPVLGTQMGGSRQGVALNLGSYVSTPATLEAAVSGMTTDGKNLYVAASGIIYRVAMTSGEISVLAGGATPVRGAGYCTPADGLGALASFCGTGQLTTDGTNLYFSDTSADLVRKIVIATGQVTTLPGLFRVNGITNNGTNIYAISNTNPQLIKIDIATGVRTVLAGSGISSIIDGTGTAAYFKAPAGMTTDGINLYITDGNTIRKINPTSGVVTTFAGSATVAGFADGVGTAATFSAPTGITTDGTSLYVSDTQHYTGGTLTNTVRKIDIATGTVSTLPISSFNPFTTDGTNLYGTTLVNGQYGIRKVQTTRAAGATAPAIVSTTVLSSTKAILSWTPVTGVTGVTTYNVYRSTSPTVALTAANKINAIAGPIAALEYTDSTLASATTYYYKVTGVITTSAETAASNEVWLRTLTAPSAPAGLAATAAGTTKIDLNWTAVDGAVSYNIYQSRSTNVQLTTINKLAASATGITTQITGLIAGTSYYYKVTAVNAKGESLGSNEASVTTTALPATVTGVTVTSFNATQINLSWTAVAGAASYNVYDGNNSSIVGNTTQTTFSATGLPLTNYRFFVRAVNAGGEVSVQPSTTVTATTLARPAAPTGATGTAASATQFNISWTAVPGATGYNLYRGTTVGFPMVVANKLNTALLTTVAYSDTALTANTTYFYKVSTVTTAGESLSSTEFSVSPPLPTIPGLKGGTIQLGALNLAANVTTIAGTSVSGTVNGAGTAASFMGVTSMATDGSYLYLVDAPAVKVRKMELATGIVSAVAGDGTYGVFGQPQGITTDGVNLYVTDSYFKKIHKIVIATGAVSLLAGSGYVGLADGQAMNASFNAPSGITTDGTNLYVLDSGNSAIRKIVIATGVVSTLSQSYLGYSESSHITHDGTNLYVTNSVQGRVLKIAMSTGATTILAGTGTATTLIVPKGITTDGTNLYVSEAYTISKIVIATGAVTSMAGAGTTGYVDGSGTTAKFSNLAGMTSDGTSLYVGDGTKIRKIQ